ncbi:MAG: DUF1592 domain-containing protein, partial [Pseudobdellovibrionaceae bacterium]
MPQDTFIPFDNYFEYASVSPAKIEAFEIMATDIATAFVNDDARLKSVLPCIPNSNKDTTCFTNIINKLGLNFLRRPLLATETSKFLALFSDFAIQGNSYQAGLDVFVRVLLQHPDFVYRSEVGSSVGGTTYRLNDFELASKLAFTLWSQPPSPDLLAAAQAGKLSDSRYFSTLVDQMLNDPRALDQLDFFHSAWLGYYGLDKKDPIKASMRNESKALIKRIVFDENRPWKDILSLKETFVDSNLASYYGLPAPSDASGAWVQQTDPLRKGLFGTGSFLSLGDKFGDTSPTQRGYTIRKQVFCEVIAPAPPDVQTDAPPRDPTNPSPCKEVQIYATVLNPANNCMGCHERMDKIGLGLENYSAQGLYRTAQPNASQCTISGNGDVVGHGTFRGPAGLADVALQSGRTEYCIVQRWLQFTNGMHDDPNMSEITDASLPDFLKDGNLRNFIRKQILSDAFRFRRAL